ncbi:MAG: AsmA-like C-terminal region-containing protein, partial [Rhodospirillales bacterium]|nr:AsmA-like C-terminal region-containing protein [Rhodospirillales bacterium]
DLSALKQANADVEIKIGKVRYRQLAAKQGLIKAKLSNGVLNTAIESLTLAKGSIVAAATVDASKPAAALTYQAKVDGVEARPLVRSFADSDRLSGTAFIETKGSAQGRSEMELVSSLKGDGSFKFLDGAIHGFNLAKTLRNLGSLGLGDSEREKTDFAELSGSFTIKKGVVDNRDFKMLAPLVRVNGAGKVPMPPRTVDYLVESKLVGSIEGQGGQEALTGVPIPIRITGPWHDISWQPDFQAALLGAAVDPSSIKALPESLKGTVEGLGGALPGLGAATGGDTSGDSGSAEPSGGVLGTLKQLTDPESAATEEGTTETTKKKKKKKKKSIEEEAVDQLKKLLD